ncbi:MAG: PAS domain-containing sensor histidine kinase [Melioribacteraceae bacterium]|nr:PAS domain-containing sensor histidine kinase [Melioribacteraceae bacterium]
MITKSLECDKDIESLSRKIRAQEEQIRTLTESAGKYKYLFDISSNAIFILDMKGRITEVNDVAIQKFKYNTYDYSLMPFVDTISKEAKSKFTVTFEKVLSEGYSVIETEQITKNGRKNPVELKCKVFNYQGSNSIQIISRDISDRKAYQETLENQRDLFQTLMDNIPDRIYFKDTNSKFTFVNEAQISNFHLKYSSDAIGKCDHDFFDKKHADQALNDERKIIKTKKAIISKIEREKIQSPNREYEWVNTTKVPIINKNGDVTGIVGISRDVTDLKNAETKILKFAKELQYLNASKDKFFSILAHDLKNPFFSLLGFAEMLENNYEELSDDEKKDYINNIIKISKNSYQLLENLLQWARAQTGRIEYRPKEINLKTLLDDSTEFFYPIAQKKNIQIKNNVKNSTYVYADPDMMKTIIRNFITNAIKFTKNGGFVRIDSSDEKSFYKITITDFGIGMDEETIKNLFRIDVQHKSFGTSNEMGTGLGLILCKEFVEKNGGKISVKSKLGEGSKFAFTVPRHP